MTRQPASTIFGWALAADAHGALWQVACEPLTATIDSYTVSAQAQEGRILQALEVWGIQFPSMCGTSAYTCC